MKLRLFLPAVVILATPQHTPPDGFVCISEQATGFRRESSSERWVAATFATNNRYIVTRSSSPGIFWEVKVTGTESAIALCEKDFNAPSGYIDCEGFERFMMNRKTLRFMTAYLIGYWTDDLNAPTDKLFAPGRDTPYLQIGRCSPI